MGDPVTSQVEACLDPETLAAYLDGVLAPEAIGRADHHIDVCASCRGELSALAATHSYPSLTSHPSSPVFPAGTGGAPEELERLAFPHDGKLGRYEILRELGRGSMGVVVRAYDPELRRAVAVKLLEPRIAHGAGARERLLREAQAMARLAHPNVVTVYDVTAHGEALAIAMELVEGTTLRAVIGRGLGWQAMLAITVAAGRGLAAAHAAKLIHRDYKPENVLCADDGRVVVSDFGLARIDERPDSLPGTTDGTVTTLAGTPAYMAPELLSGSVATIASDQFSFCVTTYEALYGERPFAGKTLDDLRASIATGVPRPAPARRGVPGRIRAALVRGLHRDPARRWPSMEALLAELTAAARPRRTRLLLAAGATAAVLAGGVAFAALRTRTPSCELEAGPGPWDRSAIEVALAGRGELAAGFLTGLDAYWGRWNGVRREACEATHVRHELSERVLDGRNGCLDRARRELSELGALVVRDPSVGARALEALEKVRDPASCTADSEALPAPPAIDRASAHLAAGQFETAISLAGDALAMMPDTHTRAEALFVRARGEIGLGKNDAAEATLAESLTAAERSHDDHLVASIWVEIVQITGAQQHRFEAAKANMRAAEAAFARIDPGPAVMSRYAYVVGAMLLAHGDAAAARTQLERALATHGGTRPGEVGLIHAALCDAARQLRQLAPAREECRKAVELITTAYGADHLRLAPTFNVRGAVELADNHLDKAREEFAHAMAIYEARGLTSERGYALAISNTATTWQRVGDFERARPLFERARDLFAAHNPDHAQRMIPLQGLASVALATGDLRTAIRYYEESLEQIEKSYGKQSTQRAITLYNLALAYQKLPDPAKANDLVEEVITISQIPGKEAWSMVASARDLQGSLAEQRKDFPAAIAARERALEALGHGDDPHTRAWIEQALAFSYRGVHDYAHAVEHYERALAYYENNPSDHYALAASRFGVARSLWDLGTARPRALQLATAARADYAAATSGTNLTQLRAELASWLAARGVGPAK